MGKGKWPETRGELGFQNKTGSYEKKPQDKTNLTAVWQEHVNGLGGQPDR